jgi:hypothetical protein
MNKASKWTQKRKNSIDCSHPKGFSERAHCQGKKKRKMKKSEVVLNELNKVAYILENMKLEKEAALIHNVFIKVASEYKNSYSVEFPMNLDDALNNYDSNTYFVDQKGSWEDAEPISDYREEVSDADLHQPAAVDDNHIVFYNEDEEHIEVMNMIPKHHMDSLHNNPDDETRTIKRAKD